MCQTMKTYNESFLRVYEGLNFVTQLVDFICVNCQTDLRHNLYINRIYFVIIMHDPMIYLAIIMHGAMKYLAIIMHDPMIYFVIIMHDAMI